MLWKELHHSKDFVVVPLGILVFSTSFTHTKYVSSRDDKQDSSVDAFMFTLPVGCGLSWWACVISEIDGIDGGRRHALFKLRSSPSVHQNLKCCIRIFWSFLQVKNTWRNSIWTGSKERFFVQNRKILSIKIYTLSTKANTKGCFGYNTRSFCSGFFILTIYFPKNGYICENIKPLYIHFFGKTNSFT